MSRIGKPTETESRLVFGWEGGGEEGGRWEVGGMGDKEVIVQGTKFFLRW